MGRPKFASSVRGQILARSDNPHGPGRCWHCGIELIDGYHIDHHPVRYADIEDQICCGQRDARDPDNLVPSCPHCNQSHAHESTRWCGRSQFPCTRGAVGWLGIGLLVVLSATGWITAGWLAWG
jgi:hypothetical protein